MDGYQTELTGTGDPVPFGTDQSVCHNNSICPTFSPFPPVETVIAGVKFNLDQSQIASSVRSTVFTVCTW